MGRDARKTHRFQRLEERVQQTGVSVFRVRRRWILQRRLHEFRTGFFRRHRQRVLHPVKSVDVSGFVGQQRRDSGLFCHRARRQENKTNTHPLCPIENNAPRTTCVRTRNQAGDRRARIMCTCIRNVSHCHPSACSRRVRLSLHYTDAVLQTT